MMDSCHAGALGKVPGPSADLSRLAEDLAAAENGIIVLTSSTAKERSLEHEDWGNGVFTEAVLEALAGRGDRDGDRWLSVSELEGYVVRRVRELTENRQNPRVAVIGEQAFEARLFVAGR